MSDFEDQIRRARRTDLADFLVANHPGEVTITGRCVHLKEYDSVYTRFGYCGYTRFSSMETGNSIDCLVRYLHYSFRDAVNALTSKGHMIPLDVPPVHHADENTFVIPEPAGTPYSRVFAYLTRQRCIPEEIILRLFREKLLYQEAKTGNAVFFSRDGSFCELRGTCSLNGQAFHGIRRRHPACFWSVKNTDQGVQRAFICESAIDAVSLMVLHMRKGYGEPSAYVSIGGVRNQQTINRIHASVPVILAVDNDPAGQACRDRNPSLESLIPVLKDWNEDLQLLSHPEQKTPGCIR